MSRLVLVDGSSFLYRAFHAMPDLRTALGEPTGALRGMIHMLARLEKAFPATHRAFVLDAPGPNFRDALYPDYKAHRPAMPEALAAQLDTLKALVPLLGWPLLQVPGVEADDVIATLTHQARARGWEVVIASGDKDLTQLVAPGVIWVDTMRDEVLDEAGVNAKFGVPPARIPEWLALVGDKVDNIPGVPGCGEKTASKWLNQYGSLAALLAHAESIPGKTGEALRQARDWLPTALQLTQVKDDVVLPVSLEALAARSPDWPALRAWFERLEFKRLLEEYERRYGVMQTASLAPTTRASDQRPGVMSAQGSLFANDRDSASAAPSATEYPATSPAAAGADPGVTSPAAAVPLPDSPLESPAAATARRARYRLIADAAQLAALAQRLANTSTLVAFDTETTSLDARHAELVGVSLAFAEGDAYYLPVAVLGLEPLRQALAPWFADARKPKVAQNLKYDWHVLAAHGMPVAGLMDDTMLMDYVLASDRPHDLDRLAERELQLQPLTYAQVCGSGKNARNFRDVPLDLATQYAAEDADLTWRLAKRLGAQLAAEPKLMRVYERIERPLVPVLAAMEAAGVKIDAARLAEQAERFGQTIAELEARAQALAGVDFNPASPKQVAAVLFERLGLKPPKKTATGQASTSEETLVQLSESLASDHPAYQLILTLLEHRRLAKLKGTYLEKLPRMIDPATGRVHTTFSQTTVVTGRLSSSDPNLQNIPIRTEAGRAIRQAFVAQAGHRLISADYSQIELRLMAHFSGDTTLIDAFRHGADIHRHTAAEILGKALAAVTPDERRLAKTINFGLIYGMSAHGLARSLGLSRSDAQAYIERYFARYPGVAAYMERTRDMARRQGYVETLFGRRLWLRDINSRNPAVRAAQERAAVNAPMQGSAADLIKLAMIDVAALLAQAFPEARLVLQVHDELLVEAPESMAEAVAAAVKTTMETVADRHAAVFAIAPLAVPLVADVGTGSHWDEAH